MKLKIEQPVVVITPTIGSTSLLRAMESVSNQTYKNITHLLVIDGPEYFEEVLKNASINIQDSNSSVKLMSLPYNVGANGFYGHRVYAAVPHLVNQSYIAFLDEDNWWEPDHIESLVSTIEDKNVDWVHSLRKVYLNDVDGGGYLADDCCESIGRWPIQWDQKQHLVDTSSYLFKREFLIQCCSLWHFGWGGDRRFFTLIKDRCQYATSGLHTLNYVLPPIDKAYGGDKKIFERNNELLKQQYGEYPWKK